MQVVKTTVNLKYENKQILDELVKNNIVSSMTDGVNQAIKAFAEQKRREQYILDIAQASKDESFMERTMTSQKDFDSIDIEVPEEW